MSIGLHGIVVRVRDGRETRTILDRVSLHIPDGAVVAVTGESGSGKSTMIAVAGLLRQPDRGRVSIDGEDATSLSSRARTRMRGDLVGLIFQSANLFPSLTAREQVEFVAHAHGWLDDVARRRARDLLKDLGLGHRLDHRPAQLSGGERQRVGIARALMSEPAVLLADEPTASLDRRRGREVMAELVDQAYYSGVATLIVTHDPELLPAGTPLLLLHEGRLYDRTADMAGDWVDR